MATVNLNRLADWRWQDNTYNDISGVGDNTAVTGHAKADDLIVCMTVRGDSDACNKGSSAAVVKVQVSKDSGSYVDIASGSGDVRCVADTITGFTDHGTCVQKAANTLTAVCGTGFAGHSTQLNGDATAPSITVASETWTEVQLLLDFTNAAAGSTYEFRVYNVTLGTAFAPDAIYGQGYPSVTIASAGGQTEDYSDTHLSGDWDEVFILGSSAFISDSLTFDDDVFYGGTDYAILAQDGDWIATQAGETIEYQHAPPAQTATPSDNLSGDWDEVFAFAFGTTVEDNLSGDWDEVFAFAFGTTIEDNLSTAWTEVFEFNFGTTITDNLSSAWTEVFEFDSEAVREDDLSGDWTEVFTFAFGTTVEDDLSTAWTDEFTFIVTASVSDNLSGEWDEAFAFAFGTTVEDDLSGDWDEVFAFDFGTTVEESITLDETLFANLDTLIEDSITLDEELITSGAGVEVVNESIALSEILLANLDSIIDESITLSETLLADLDSIITESITLSEDSDFAFGTTLEESITLDEELVADITGGADPAVLQDTLTFSEVLNTGIVEQPILAQDGDTTQTQAGDDILTQEVGLIDADLLIFGEVLTLLKTLFADIDEDVSFSELLSTVAVTDDLLINESITLSEQLVTNILLRPVKSQAPELILGADGTYLEAQYTEADTSHTFETFTLADQLDTLIGRYAPVSDTLSLIDLVTGVPTGALTPSDSLTLAEDLAADIGRLLTVNESFSFTELFEFKFNIRDSLVFRDYISTADEYQYLWDGVYFSEDLYATLSEYTGAVFWFGEWIQLFVSLVSELEDALDLDDEIIGTGQYGLLLDTLQAATEEDRVTPWTEEDGTALAEEHGSVDLYFTESLTYGTLTSSTAEEFRFVDNFYLQEYAMPCPPATGPCTTEVTGSCAAPKTLSTSAGSVPSDFAVTGSLFYLSFTWTPFASGSLRIFFRKKLTEEKWSTILVDGIDGSVETPNELDIGDYEGGVRYEDDSYYSAWTPFEFELPEYEDSVALTETLALLAARKRTRVDTIAFEETLALV